MKYYSYDTYGYYLSWWYADESPLEPGVFVPPAQATFVEPPEVDVTERCRWNGEEWIVELIPDTSPSLEALAEMKRAELWEACSREITRSSFQSTALGQVHNYDCREVDQTNLLLRYNVSSSTTEAEPLWASDGTRFQWKPHTAAQLLVVMEDMNEHIKALQMKLVGKLAAVDAVTVKTDIAGIVW